MEHIWTQTETIQPQKEVFYISIRHDKDWAEKLPDKDWQVMVIYNEENNEIKEAIVENCLKKNVQYFSLTWKYLSSIDREVDHQIVTWVLEKIGEERYSTTEDFKDSPMSSKNENLAEAFWCSLYSPLYNEGDQPSLVICLDFDSKKNNDILKELLIKFNKWLFPEDL